MFYKYMVMHILSYCVTNFKHILIILVNLRGYHPDTTVVNTCTAASHKLYVLHVKVLPKPLCVCGMEKGGCIHP